ncbi:MAG: metabolite traffic protein EboE [Planctomycetes bacterium]|nr:metabolite traffic protein EboE [Planctomycetota bacterium]
MLVPVAPRRPPLLLSYEMNVHPARTATDLLTAIDDFVVPIRRSLAPGAPFGIVPHIGRTLVNDLAPGEHREALREALARHDLFIFSINAFPLEDFHQERVKASVYDPPWTDPERARITHAIADLVADLVPDRPSTISTLGGTYRAWGDDAPTHRAIAHHYASTVVHLAEIERRTGRTITLTVEPEPDTTFETAEDVVRLLRGHLLPHAREWVGDPLGVSRSEAEALIHRFFEVNLDVCHQSVLFRDPIVEWRALEDAGLRVGKLHATNAIAMRHPGRSPRARQELDRFDEPRYLHQFAARRRDGVLLRGADLDRLDEVDLDECDELRVHYHVPLSRARLGRLTTTRDDTARALAFAAGHDAPPHVVVETYTWPLLLADGEFAARHRALVDGLRRELRWTRRALAAR